MERKTTFGLALRSARVKQGIGQEQLGSQSFISTVERGLRSPTVEKMEEISALLKISPVTLITLAQIYAGENLEDVIAKVKAEIQELENGA